MEWQRAGAILGEIERAGRSDPVVGSLVTELLQIAVRYARLRVDWLAMAGEGREQVDAERSRAHEALLDACNILSRRARQHGLDTRWREELGTSRGEVGDWACYVHCIVGLRAR